MAGKKGRPSESGKHHVMLALLGAAESHRRFMPSGAHVCDPLIAAAHACDLAHGYVSSELKKLKLKRAELMLKKAKLGKAELAKLDLREAELRSIEPDLIRSVVHNLGNSLLAHGRDTAPDIENVVRPSQMAVLAALPQLGIEPPTNLKSLDVAIRRLVARGGQLRGAGRRRRCEDGIERVTGFLSVLSMMES